MVRPMIGVMVGMLLGVLAPARAAVPAPPAIHFAADEWPPFVTASMPDNGLSGALVAAVYQRMGYQATVDYFPWKRTMEFGLHHPHYAGFMAVWRTPEREKLCHFSAPIGNTQTVLAYLKSSPVYPEALDGVRVGTVAGYAYGAEFDALNRRGALTAEEGLSDEMNLRKLLIGRFRAIVIEKHVLMHLLRDPHFSELERAQVDYFGQLFKARPVAVCFKRTAQGKAQQRAFNAAAHGLDLDQVERQYWQRLAGGA